MSDSEQPANDESQVGDRWRGVKLVQMYNLEHGKLCISQGSVVHFQVSMGERVWVYVGVSACMSVGV